jgi:Secretion system C-terminal sorting domain
LKFSQNLWFIALRRFSFYVFSLFTSLHPSYGFLRDFGFSNAYSPNIYTYYEPDLWYSIYDANSVSEQAVLSYAYYRYENEFVGEALDPGDWSLDAVFPSTLILPIGQVANNNTCGGLIPISWPQPRINPNLTGFDRNDQPNRFFAYPNPTSKEIFIRSDRGEDFTFKIYSSLGQRKMEGDFFQEKFVDINVSQLIDGFYILEIISEGTKQKLPIIIKN